MLLEALHRKREPPCVCTRSQCVIFADKNRVWREAALLIENGAIARRAVHAAEFWIIEDDGEADLVPVREDRNPRWQRGTQCGDGLVASEEHGGIRGIEPRLRKFAREMHALGEGSREPRHECLHLGNPGRWQLAEIFRAEQQSSQDRLQCGGRRVAAEDMQDAVRCDGTCVPAALRDETIQRGSVAEFRSDEREQRARGDFAEGRECRRSLRERACARGGVGHGNLRRTGACGDGVRCRCECPQVRNSGQDCPLCVAQDFIRAPRAAARDGGGVAAEQLKAIRAAHREVGGLDREHAADIRDVEEPQHATAAGRDFHARLGIYDERAQPRRRGVRASEAARVGLRGKFRHPVFIPHGVGAQAEVC